MKLFTVLALIIAVFAVIFASQNSETVAIHLLSLSYQTSMGLIALVTFSVGVLVGLFISVPPMIARMSKISSLKRRVEEQNREIESLNKILESSKRNDFPQQL